MIALLHKRVGVAYPRILPPIVDQSGKRVRDIVIRYHAFCGAFCAEWINDDRLYRALDWLLRCCPHKRALEGHLKWRLGELLGFDCGLLLYDVTSKYFEGQARRQSARPAWP
jgi:hypothetical protein